MLLSTRIKFALALWFALEALLFIIVVKLVGVGGAILLGLLTSLIGLSTIRRAGASAMMKARQAMSGRQAGGLVEVREESLATLGALALLLPGFLSDLIGLALITPALRGLVSGRILAVFAARTGRPRAQHGPSTIDLDRQDWSHTDGSPRSMPRA